MSEAHFIDLLPAYALGCLDEDDLKQVSQHLSGCAACRKELAAYQATSDQLALAVPYRQTPPDLRAKVMRRVEQRARAAQPAALHQASKPAVFSWESVRASLQGLLRSPVQLAFGTLAVLLLVFLGISNLALGQQVSNLQAHVPAGNVRVITLQGTASAPQATAYVMIFANENYGTLTVEDVPVLDAAQQYQLWLIKDGKRTSGGTFSVSEDGYGVLKVTADQPLDSYQSFGITIEPAGGSPGPTGPKVLGGNL